MHNCSINWDIVLLIRRNNQLRLLSGSLVSCDIVLGNFATFLVLDQRARRFLILGLDQVFGGIDPHLLLVLVYI